MDQTIKQVKGASKQDIINFVYNSLNDNGWKTTFNYQIHRPRKFFGKPLLIPDGNRADFFRYADYCYLLSTNFNHKDEVARYEDRNGTGIYFSVVLYWLLVHFGVVSDRNLRFCQGYFCYQREDDESPKPIFRAGMHAWLCHNGSVIDMTIWQQKNSFDFQKRGLTTAVFLGEVPDGMSLFGFEEEKSLVKEYARRFARESGMSFYEWIRYHKDQATLLSDVRAVERLQSEEPVS